MNPMTIETMLQIGYGCGLSSIDEAYSQVMQHYACFFPVDGFDPSLSTFNQLLIDAGLTYQKFDADVPYNRLKNISIVDAANQLGIILKEIELPPDNSQGDQGFDSLSTSDAFNQETECLQKVADEVISEMFPPNTGDWENYPTKNPEPYEELARKILGLVVRNGSNTKHNQYLYTAAECLREASKVPLGEKR